MAPPTGAARPPISRACSTCRSSWSWTRAAWPPRRPPWSRGSPAIVTMSRWPASSSIGWAARRTRRCCAGPAMTGLPSPPAQPLRPLGQRIAVARDLAFAFAYPAVLDGWRAAGAELSFFSPLADAPPDPNANAVYLPGGYPELHPARLAANHALLNGLRAAADRGTFIYGECGGFMALGQCLIDGQ